MNKFSTILLITCVIIVATAGTAFAQDGGELQLGLSRDWGYGGFGNDIQGLFSMKFNNPPSGLSRVVFQIDGESIGEDTQAPFSLQFNTDSYPLGVHALNAVGYQTNGGEIPSNTIQAEFVPASAATSFIAKFLLPVLGLVVLLILLSVGLPLILNKGKLSSRPLGAQRKYGIGGGAICPKCSRPFPLRLWWINLGWNKIDRCPYCGKWSFVRPRALYELRAAEAAELANARPDAAIPGESDTDKLHKNLDDSKYQDL